MNLKKVCFVDKKGEKKCIDRIGHPPIVAKHIKKILEDAINKGVKSINPNEIIYLAEYKTQFEDKKISPFIKVFQFAEKYSDSILKGELKEAR